MMSENNWKWRLKVRHIGKRLSSDKTQRQELTYYHTNTLLYEKGVLTSHTVAILHGGKVENSKLGTSVSQAGR